MLSNIHTFMYIINFMGHDLAIINMGKIFFIGLHGVDTDVIHIFVLFHYNNMCPCTPSDFTRFE